MAFQRSSLERAFQRARETNPALFDRLMPHVKIAGPGDCWPTDFAKDGDGYSCIKVAGKAMKSHRAMYYLFHPHENPPVVRHMCNNPACVNPAHLRGGTQKDNVDDRVSMLRGGNLKGENNGRSKLTTDHIAAIRSSPDNCTALGKTYGVSKVMISKIKRGIAWSHI